MGVILGNMGCGGTKDEKPALTAEEERARIRAEQKRAWCTKIVEALDTNHNGKMDAEEVQGLVKNMHPEFLETPIEDIPLDHPHVQALDGMSKLDLVDHLCNTMDDGWLHAYAMLLGLSGDPERAKAIEVNPGIYEVIWPGGVRYRDSNRYNAIVEKRKSAKDGSKAVVGRAAPGQTFRIKHFVSGDLCIKDGSREAVAEVWYGYVEWPRLFLPMSFPDGEPTMKRIADYGDAQQLEKMAGMIYDEMEKITNEKNGVPPEVILEYLKGAKIGYDHESLLDDLKSFDVGHEGNNDGRIQKEEFIKCFTETHSISDCLWIDTDEYEHQPHPKVVEAFFAKNSPKRVIKHEDIEQM